MGIKEKGYIRWNGEIPDTRRHWLPIVSTGILRVWKKKYSKLAFGFSLLPFVSFAAALYAVNKPELKSLSQVILNLPNDEAIFNAFFTFDPLIFMLIILSAFSGSDLISSDLKTRALPLYFSRPITKAEYLWGKSAVILFYLLLFSLVPGILLLILKMLFTGSLDLSFRLISGTIGYPILVSLFLTALTLFLSSLTPNTKLITIIIFVVYVFNDGFASILREILKNDIYYLFSIQKNCKQLGTFFFAAGKPSNFPLWYSPLLLLSLILCLVFLLFLKIRRVESQA